MDKVKIFLAGAVGILSAWIGDVGWMIALVFLFILFDYITGILASGREHNISSTKATDGIYKKVGLILLMVLGFGLDAAITCFASEGLNFDLPFQLPFGLMVSAWIIINESISILENLVRLEAPVPAWLVKFLKIAKDKLDTEGDVQ